MRSISINVLAEYDSKNIDELTPTDMTSVLVYGYDLFKKGEKLIGGRQYESEQRYRDHIKEIEDKSKRALDDARAESTARLTAKLEEWITDKTKIELELFKARADLATGIERIRTEEAERLKKEMIDTTAALRQEIKETRREANARIEQLLRECEVKKDEARKAVEAKYEQALAERQRDDARVSDAISAQFSGLRESLAVLDLIKRSYTVQPASKGKIGEERVMFLLREFFPAAMVDNVAKRGHMADIIFTLAKMMCLIEIKNKTVITQADIDKFYRDIHEQRDDAVNCALFISLDTPNIPGKGAFLIEVRESVPIVFMHLASDDLLANVIHVLGFIHARIDLLNENKSKESSELFVDASAAMLLLNTTLSGQLNFIAAMRAQVKTMTKAIQEAELSVERCMDQLKVFYTKHPSMSASEIPKSGSAAQHAYSREDIGKLKAWAIEHKQIPKRDDIMAVLGYNEREMRSKSVKLPELKIILQRELAEEGFTFSIIHERAKAEK